jgi:hypothetical protein
MECVYPGAEGIYPIPLNLSDLGNDE